jgi:hypothetical protein
VSDVTALSPSYAMARSKIVLVHLLMKLAPRLTMKTSMVHPRKVSGEGPGTWPTAGGIGRALGSASRPDPCGRPPPPGTMEAAVRPAAPRVPNRLDRHVSAHRGKTRYDAGPTVAPLGPARNPRPLPEVRKGNSQMVTHHRTSQRAQPSILSFLSVQRRGRQRGHRRAGPSCQLW